MAEGLDELTAEQLRARIRQEVERTHQERNLADQADNDVTAALERQRLRRELEEQMEVSRTWRSHAQFKRYRRSLIDRDQTGAHAPDGDRPSPHLDELITTPGGSSALVKATVRYDTTVEEREFTWEIGGLSWLPYALKQEGRGCVDSPTFRVDDGDEDSKYRLVYSPDASSLDPRPDGDYPGGEYFSKFDSNVTKGTLALIRNQAHYGTNLDVSFFVRDAASGNFTQWGDRARFSVPARDEDDGSCCVHGPDVAADTKGIFGLSFDELLRSQWVKDDVLTVKVVIKEVVMKDHPDSRVVRLGDEGTVVEHLQPQVEVPSSTLAAELLAMLTEGQHSDLTVEAVYGDAEPVRFAAHAGVLARRSAVFRAALQAGMSESATRTITVRDTPPPVLKALLHYLYTDDFDQVDAALREDDSGSSAPATAAAASSGASPSKAGRMAQLQAVLVAAHKWCEQQLCDLISGETVCSLLSLAHVYEGTALENNCLNFVKANMAQVATRPEYVALAPAILVKVQLHAAGVEPAESKKRKRSAD